MALGLKPTLTEINTEIGVSGQSLSTCVGLAGKTGVWDRQSDFASYTHGIFSIAPSGLAFDSTGNPSQDITITSNGAWTLTATSWVNPSTLTGSGNDTVGVTCDANVGIPRTGNVQGELDSNPTLNDSVLIDQDEP